MTLESTGSPTPPATHPPRSELETFTSPKFSVRRSNNFNFFRLVLAYLVIVSHSSDLIDFDRHREMLVRIFHNLGFGDVAVLGFFLLSGYLIVQSWNSKPRLGVFLKNRILRICPGFIVASLISAFIFAPLGAQASVYFSQFNFRSYLFGLMLLRKPMTPPCFAWHVPPLPLPEVNGAMWSITYEFRCYLIVAALGVVGLFKTRGPWVCLTALALVVSYFSQQTAEIVTGHGLPVYLAGLRHFLRFFSIFGCGGCFYLFREHIRYNGWLALLALFLMIPFMYSHRLVVIGLGTVGAYAFFWLGFRHFAITPRLAKLPDISYGVYLYGWPTQKLISYYLPNPQPLTLFFLSTIGATLLGYLSCTLVEQPFLRLKAGKKAEAAPSAPGATNAGVLAGNAGVGN
jgi:peptidoglycan/LPS O-acetylase OafA/YrhL